jgi:hydrogenase assembly chaperone HypC/HupF
MCLAYPVLLVQVEPDGRAFGIVDGRVRPITLTALDATAAPGDWVLVQAGFAVSPLDPHEAMDLANLLCAAKGAG